MQTTLDLKNNRWVLRKRQKRGDEDEDGDSPDRAEECSICQDEKADPTCTVIHEGDDSLIKHIFCCNCIQQWCENKNPCKCPLCNRPISRIVDTKTKKVIWEQGQDNNQEQDNQTQAGGERDIYDDIGDLTDAVYNYMNDDMGLNYSTEVAQAYANDNIHHINSVEEALDEDNIRTWLRTHRYDTDEDGYEDDNEDDNGFDFF